MACLCVRVVHLTREIRILRAKNRENRSIFGGIHPTRVNHLPYISSENYVMVII